MREQGLAPEAGEHLVVELALEPGGTARGTVVGAGGKPIEGATVEAALAGRFFGVDDLEARRVETGADGLFELSGLPHGAIKVRANHPRYLQTAKVNVDVPAVGATEGITLELADGATIGGRVSWRDGRAASGVSVRASFDQAFIAGMSFFNSLRGADASTEAREDGAFTLLGVGGGPFSLTVSETVTVAEGVEQEWSARLDGVRPQSKGIKATGIELVLRPPLGVYGRVVDTEQEPWQFRTRGQ